MPGKGAVIVNFDETSIRLHQKIGPGFLVKLAREQKRLGKLTQDVSKGQLLGTFNHVAMICSDLQLQPHLPQFIFMNKSHISLEQFDSIKTELLPNIHPYRVDNPWMTAEKMKLVMKALADTAKQHTPGKRILLCGDTYKAHSTRGTWAAAAAHGIFYFMVPPKLTWALQPCDTHVFAMFKNKLSKTCQRLAIANGAGSVDVLNLIRALNETIDEIINKRCWRKAFSDVGLLDNQRLVSARTRRNLDFENVDRLSPPPGVPTLSELTCCFPQRTDIPIGHVFSAVLRAERQAEHRPLDLSHGPCSATVTTPSSEGSQTRPRLPRMIAGSTVPMLVRLPSSTPPRPQLPPALWLPTLRRLPSAGPTLSEPAAHSALRPPLPPPRDSQ